MYGVTNENRCEYIIYELRTVHDSITVPSCASLFSLRALKRLPLLNHYACIIHTGVNLYSFVSSSSGT